MLVKFNDEKKYVTFKDLIIGEMCVIGNSVVTKISTNQGIYTVQKNYVMLGDNPCEIDLNQKVQRIDTITIKCEI